MRLLHLLALLLFPLVGCSPGPYRIAHVSGRVTLNGQPLAHASVSFQPLPAGRNHNPGPGSGGFTDADGRYTLKLIGTDTAGAVVGKHMVRITRTVQDNSADDRPKRFKNPPPKHRKRMELEFDVPAGGTSSADFQLTSP